MSQREKENEIGQDHVPMRGVVGLLNKREGIMAELLLNPFQSTVY